MCRTRKALVVVVTFVLIVLQSSCDSMTMQNSVAVKALYSENTLEFPIKSKQEGYYYYLGKQGTNRYGATFDTSIGWSEVIAIIEQELEKTPGRNLRVFSSLEGTGWLDALISVEFEGKTDCFLLRMISRDCYVLSPMGAEIVFEGDNINDDGGCLLLPLHLVADARMLGSSAHGMLSPRIYEGVEYELRQGVSAQEFLDFYNSSGWCEVEFRDEVIILTPPTETPGLTTRDYVRQTVTIQ